MVVECELPAGGALDADFVACADFCDSYRVPLRRRELDVIDIFFAVFAHRPAWMTALLIARNQAAALAGLETPRTSDVVKMARRSHYAVGELIGPWPIFFLGPDELVAGRDNKHMDFRLSVRRVGNAGGPSAVVSTLCKVNNEMGRYYLAAVIPFHKFGVRSLMARAVAAQRL